MAKPARIILSILFGIGLIVFLMLVFRWGWFISAILGLVAFFGLEYLLSWTPLERAQRVIKKERELALRTAEEQLRVTKSFRRHLELPTTVRGQLGQIVGFAEDMLSDMREPSRVNLPRLQEMNSFLGDLNAAVKSYVGIVSGSVVIPPGSDKQAMLQPLEQELPTYVSGFNSLAASSDAEDAALISMKTSTLRLKMLVRGRLEEDQTEPQ
ncbi:MAG: hypothetical protein ACYCZF_14860 [Anaerolineae bacterium]